MHPNAFTWRANAAAGRPSVLFCYAFGKAQRVLAELAALGDPAIVAVPVVALSTLADANEAIVGWPKIAKHLGVSPKTAERMEKDGRLPEAYRPTPRKPTYRREQLDTYLKQKRR